jgi:phosphoribosylanthranilate isomerase
MFHVKICGITSVDDAQVAIRAGADALGLNFYRKSARAIDVQMARQIGNRVPHGVAKIGVFVNADPDEVAHTFYEAGLDAVQLHGDEPPEYLADLVPRPIVRAFRLGDAGLADVDAYLDQCSRLDAMPAMILVDAFSADAYGGTGNTVDWSRLAADCQQCQLPPLVLAGGLAPENVAEAIRIVRPVAVDVASGVEHRPGRKDPDRVRHFVAAARAAFDATTPI